MVNFLVKNGITVRSDQTTKEFYFNLVISVQEAVQCHMASPVATLYGATGTRGGGLGRISSRGEDLYNTAEDGEYHNYFL